MINCQGSNVFIGPEAWAEFERLIVELSDSGKKIYVLSDENTSELCGQKLQDKFGVFSDNILIIEAGEASKNIEIAHHLWSEMLETGADRQSILLNIGGGVVTDLGGFVASTFKRGIPFVNIPTSLMGMADAAIGGKCGIDLGSAKNQVGTFTLPTSTLIMPEFLNTLLDVELKSGFAECIKHGLLQGNSLWKEVVEQDPANLNAEFLTQIVQVKIDVVNQDPKEMGLRKSLNLGHTIGHAIESAAMQIGNPLQHGHCVILGLLAELRISEIELGLDSDVLKQFSALADQHYMELRSHKVEFESLYPFMKLDKKNDQNEVRFVLLKSLGQTEVDLAVSEGVIQEGVNHLKKWQSR